MNNPFIDPAISRRYAKITVEGSWGSGKTHFALTWPKPAIIDPEHGTDLFVGREFQTPHGVLQPFEFKALYSRSIFKAIEAAEFVIQNPGVFETLIIDPITLLWEQAQDAYLETLAKKIASGRSHREETGISFGDWKEIKRPYKRLITKLIEVPAHVILLGRVKDDYSIKEGQPIKVGESIDAEKSTPYISDIYLRIRKQAGKRLGEVVKDRSQCLEGKTIENPTYYTFAPIIERLQELKNGNEVKIETDEEVIAADAHTIENKESIKKQQALLARIKKAEGFLGAIGEKKTYDNILQKYCKEDLENETPTILTNIITELETEYRVLSELKKEN